MKSEHRHELQTNALASELGSLPETLRKHSSKILTVLALVLLVIAGVRYKRSQDSVQQENTRLALAEAWNMVGGFSQVDPTEPADIRQKKLDEIENNTKAAVQMVIDGTDASSDKAKLASAYWASGELYWGLATQSPIATTQPATQPTTRPTNYLDLAKTAYQKIVTDFADQAQPLTAARFALAAIAENRQDWNAAREQYKLLLELDTDSVKTLAKSRMDLLERLEKPLLLLPPAVAAAGSEAEGASSLLKTPDLMMSPTIPATLPTTLPSPAAAASTQPTTQP